MEAKEFFNAAIDLIRRSMIFEMDEKTPPDKALENLYEAAVKIDMAKRLQAELEDADAFDLAELCRCEIEAIDRQATGSSSISEADELRIQFAERTVRLVEQIRARVSEISEEAETAVEAYVEKAKEARERAIDDIAGGSLQWIGMVYDLKREWMCLLRLATEPQTRMRPPAGSDGGHLHQLFWDIKPSLPRIELEPEGWPA